MLLCRSRGVIRQHWLADKAEHELIIDHDARRYVTSATDQRQS
jgi:hypothetical protein